MSPISTRSRCHRYLITPIAVITLLFGTLALPVPNPVRAAGDDYSISGTVTRPGGGPLAGITVSAWCMSTNFWCDVSDLTVGDGSYTLAGLAAGSYKVHFSDESTSSASGYAAGFYGTHGFTASRDGATVVDVPQDATDINVELPLGYLISGTVSGPGGTGIGGIQLNLWSITGGFGIDVGLVATDTDGAYTVGGSWPSYFRVPAGSYAVGFWDPSGTYVSGFYRASGFTTNQDDATPVAVPDDKTGIDVELPLGMQISGIVTGPDGTTPLEGIDVSVNGVENFGWEPGTDHNGTYSIAVPPNAAYTVSLQDNTGTHHVAGCYSSSAPGHFTTDQDACTPVPVEGSDVTVPDITMPLGVVISGTVTDLDGTALGNIDVTATTTEGNFGAGNATDADGAYSLTVRADTDYRLDFGDGTETHFGGCYNSHEVPGHLGMGMGMSVCTAVEVADSDVGLLDVQLPLVVFISGTVTDPSGPLGGIEVEYNPPTTDDGTWAVRVPQRSDATVSFTDLSITHVDGCYSVDAPGHIAFGKDADCTPIPAGDSGVTGIVVEMQPGGVLSGAVHDDHGNGLPDIVISARSGTAELIAYTDEHGNYAIALPPDTYTVDTHDNEGRYFGDCYRTGDDQECTHLTVGIDGQSGIDLVMQLGIRISGTVTGPDGTTPLENIDVSASSDDFGTGTGTGGDGAYSLMVPPGHGAYTLQFHDTAGAHVDGCYSSNSQGHFSTDNEACTPVPVADSDVTGIDVAMTAGVVISGRVTEAGGTTGLADITVDANDGNDAEGWHTSASTGADGTYSMVVLPNRAYGVSFTDEAANRHISACYTDNPPDNLTTDWEACTLVPVGTEGVGNIDVAMTAGVAISGKVTEADGTTGLEGIQIDTQAAGGWGFGASTGADGTYLMVVLPNRDYELAFHDDNGVYVNGCYADNPPGNLTTDGAACTLVPVGSSEVTGIDVRMSLRSGRLDHLVVSPTTATISAGQSQAFTAEGYDVDGTDLGDVTADSIFTISGTGSCTGAVCSAGEGDHTVTASDGSATGSATLHVRKAQTITFDALPDVAYGVVPITLTATASSGLPVNFAASGSCTVSGAVATTIGAGTCQITVSQPGDGSYDPATPVSRTFTVGPARLTIRADDKTKEFGAPLPPFTATYLGFVNGDGPADLSGTLTLSTTATESSLIGKYPITATGLTSPDYTITFIPGTLTVTKMGQTIGFAPLPPRTMAQSPFNVSASASSGLSVTFTTAYPTVCTAGGRNGATITLVGPGTCVVLAMQSGNPIYNPAPTVGQGFIVSRLNQTIAFAPLPPRTIVQTPFNVSASASSGLSVTFTTAYPSVCTAGGKNGQTITLVGPGTCIVLANQNGNAIYNPAPTVGQGFSVSLLSQTITFGPLPNRTMVQSPFNVSAGASSGLAVLFATQTPSVCTAGGPNGHTISLVGPGQCTVVAYQPGNAIYYTAPAVPQSFIVSRLNQAISFAPLPPRTIVQTPFNVNAGASSGLSVTFATQTPSVCTAGGPNGHTITLVGPGTCVVLANQNGNATYNPAPTVGQGFTVSRLDQTIAFAPLPNRTIKQSPFTVNAGASSGLAVTFTTQTPTVCTAGGKNGATITLVGPGTCVVLAMQSGNPIYNPAPTVGQGFNVR